MSSLKWWTDSTSCRIVDMSRFMSLTWRSATHVKGNWDIAGPRWHQRQCPLLIDKYSPRFDMIPPIAWAPATEYESHTRPGRRRGPFLVTSAIGWHRHCHECCDFRRLLLHLLLAVDADEVDTDVAAGRPNCRNYSHHHRQWQKAVDPLRRASNYWKTTWAVGLTSAAADAAAVVIDWNWKEKNKS